MVKHDKMMFAYAYVARGPVKCLSHELGVIAKHKIFTLEPIIGHILTLREEKINRLLS